ncbi:MAG: hypothetical protein NZ901_02035 [Geminocystis sp.]|nr:hypothetical protein [Geminocystis sp.]HIK37850.1 hypothetical protein [Geminocystis sp. M7585_C2015_104]MCS7146950.1 hypothetical protein [Geminocystis sp.]MCX8077262.1 hypothetical protein [Geminocystis sp.]MDW8115774.1 hypothetical protein [Geminocystis sp.]
MKYLVAVLSDRIQAEEVYTALEKAGIPTTQMSILGKGYKGADEFGFIDPSLQARKNAIRMAIWLIPFGFFAGYTFDLITTIDAFAWAGKPWNHIIGGFLGAIGGALGSIFVGGGIGFTSGSGDALSYRNRLNAGKYIVVVKGDNNIKNQATEIIRQFNPENLQGYETTDP